jgi:type I restriction enzyme R subunit
MVNALRVRAFRRRLTVSPDDRKAFVYLLARSPRLSLSSPASSPTRAEVKEFATFAEYVGPQLIKQGSVSDLMKQIRADRGCQGGGANIRA